MANLAESAVYDAGVYQLEVTDAVVGGAGGVANAAAKNLANRTAYLKAQVDAIQSGNATKIGVRDGLYNAAAAGGAADALTASFTPAVTALVNGATLHVRGISANATATPTLAVNGLAAKTIVKGNDLPLVAGDIAGAGHWLELQYDSLLDVFVLQNPAKGIDVLSVADFTGANQSLTPVGFQNLPGDFIEKWGYAAVNIPGDGGLDVTFSTAFPNACFGVLLIFHTASDSMDAGPTARNLTAAGFRASNCLTGSTITGYFYRAIGY